MNRVRRYKPTLRVKSKLTHHNKSRRHKPKDDPRENEGPFAYVTIPIKT
jgi:hypothetical protein